MMNSPASPYFSTAPHSTAAGLVAHPVAETPGALAIDEVMRRNELRNASLGIQCRTDDCHTAEHPVTAETRGEPIDVRHAIDDRQNRCFRTDRRCDCSMASSSEYDFTASRMRSNGSPMVSARTARAGSEKSPCGLMTRSPSRADWAARAARTMNVTSRTSPDETSAEISAECTCSDHQNTHEDLIFVRAWRLRRAGKHVTTRS